jgi:UMF1 family MFS transporter
VTRFLLSFYFFSDAQLTIFLFAAIYLDRVLSVPDVMKIVIFWIVLGSMVIGAFVGGWLGDRIGSRTVYLYSIVLDALVMLAVAIVPNMTLYYVLFALYGLSAGGAYAVSRSLLSDLIPYSKKAQFFSLYSLFERFASILGPAVWGIVVWTISAHNGLNYRLAVTAMGIFVLIAAVIVKSLPNKSKYVPSV